LVHLSLMDSPHWMVMDALPMVFFQSTAYILGRLWAKPAGAAGGGGCRGEVCDGA
jgi:hypothetical protein